MALEPLAERFGIEKVLVITMQAVSGAGYPGVASLDILGNVIPLHRQRRREDGRGDAEAAGPRERLCASCRLTSV